MSNTSGWQVEKRYEQKVYHYIDERGMSLCRKLGFYFGEKSNSAFNENTDCKACKKILDKNSKG